MAWSGMTGLCMRGAALQVVGPGEDAASSLSLPPLVPTDSSIRGRAQELHRQLSHLREPMLVPRDQCLVNLDFDLRLDSTLATVLEAGGGSPTATAGEDAAAAAAAAAGFEAEGQEEEDIGAAAAAAVAAVAAMGGGGDGASGSVPASSRPSGTASSLGGGAGGTGARTTGTGLAGPAAAGGAGGAAAAAAAAAAAGGGGGGGGGGETGAPSSAAPSARPSQSGQGTSWEDGQGRRGFVKVKSIRAPKGLEWSHSRKCLEVLIQSEKAGGGGGGGGAGRTGSPAFKGHEQRLRERLERLNLDMLIVAGDGNCQFRSVSNELYGTQEHHAAIRRQAVAHIVSQRDSFECFLGEDFDVYVRQMSRSGTWGDELTLRAVCDSFGLTVHVVTSDVDHWYLTYEPEARKLDREIFLTYIAPIHYNSIRRQSSLKTMALTVSRSFKKLSSGGLASPAPPVSSPLASGGRISSGAPATPRGSGPGVSTSTSTSPRTTATGAAGAGSGSESSQQAQGQAQGQTQAQGQAQVGRSSSGQVGSGGRSSSGQVGGGGVGGDGGGGDGPLGMGLGLALGQGLLHGGQRVAGR